MRFLKLIIALYLLVNCFSTNAQVNPLFSADSMLEMRLVLNKQAIMSDRGDHAQEHEAVLKYTELDGSMGSVNVKLRVRGRFRRDKETCNFPPLRINFPKKKVKKTLFHGQNKIKMVTHCQDEMYILKEYMVYKTYNLLTDYSFRVRLAKITYIDTEHVAETETRYAFFIEDEEDLAERLGGEPLGEDQILSDEETQQDFLRNMHMFHYMIGNKDFRVMDRQNVKIIETKDYKVPIVIPYDFDWAGIVDASYTQISGLKKAAKLEKRKYKGLCPSEADLNSTIDLFKNRQKDIYRQVAGFEYLDKPSKKAMLKYFRQFYKLIDKPKVKEEQFMARCKGS